MTVLLHLIALLHIVDNTVVIIGDCYNSLLMFENCLIINKYLINFLN